MKRKKYVIRTINLNTKDTNGRLDWTFTYYGTYPTIAKARTALYEMYLLNKNVSAKLFTDKDFNIYFVDEEKQTKTYIDLFKEGEDEC